MAWIRTVEEGEAEGMVKSLYKGLQKKVGMVQIGRAHV